MFRGFTVLLFSSILCISSCENEPTAEGKRDATKSQNQEIAPNISPEFVVEGTISRVSSFPEPSKAEYKECCFSTVIKTQNLSENLELNVYFWAFRDRKLSETGGLYPGATVKFRAIDFNSRSDLKSVMRADDISRFDLPVYFGEFVGALITRDNFRRPSKFEKLEAPVNRIESQIGMLSAMNDSLKKRGIKLLVVPTPFKEEIVPSVKELQPVRRSS